jgi:DMSO/TMAO reductase YedYZ molybdopterin-dependent catalytic subunit
MQGDTLWKFLAGAHTISLSRRSFLARTGQVAGLAALGLAGPGARIAAAQNAPAVSAAGEFPGVIAGMRIISKSPTNLETSIEHLRSWVTPEDAFFVRLHLPQYAQISEDAWDVSVSGEVGRPLRLAFGDLRQFETVDLVAWLQCAGNRRGHFQPRAAGGQWDRGAVGNARWRGVRLRDVLLAASPTVKAHHVAFEGGDPHGDAPPYVRSIPIEKALDPNTLLVYEMNGAPLPLLHGFPVRALVPGWVGSANVKWLRAIHLVPEEWTGPYMKDLYRINAVPISPDDKSYTFSQDFLPTTRFPVNSFFTSPVTGDTVPAGPVTLTGVAYAGETGISKVDVSVDGGKTWSEATFTMLGNAFAWYQWRKTVTLASGAYQVVCRATDWQGRTQPREALWNPQGYFYNAWDVLDLTIS